MKVELKNKIVFGLWLLFALSVIVLLVAASHKRKKLLCNSIKINIENAEHNFFITQNEIEAVINSAGNVRDKSIKDIDIKQLENALKKNAWIKTADLFFDNNNNIICNIEQRRPTARLFNVYGTSHYLDNYGLRLPLKPSANARVLVVTGFTSNNEVLAHTDSLLLQDVTQLAKHITTDTFWNAQIAQVNITPEGKFELIPTVGNHYVIFGDASNIKEKLTRLYIFYTKAFLKNGIERYAAIDVRFNNQVIGVQKNVTTFITDTISKRADVIDTVNQSVRGL